ncbi:MAG: response regulator transcription factor [Acidobacteria bacterium]|nr:response regulator transcription factor [Acidobacteriota bacterium]
MASLTLVIADDHLLVRQAIRALLEREHLTVAGEAGDGIEAVRQCEQLQPDILLLDVAMPAMNGISAIGDVLRRAPRTRIILLSMHTEEHYVLEALRAGVKGCVSKTQAADHLLRAIRDVGRGDIYLSPTVSNTVVQAYLSKSDLPHDLLTGRERQVLQLVAEGKTTKEVAVILGVTVKTAETHRTRLMEKLDVHSAAGLVRYAVRKGFIEP